MAKLKLTAEPTFKASVDIPVAGAPDVPVAMTFKHRTKKELQAFLEEYKTKDDVDMVLACVLGWDLTDEFNRENVDLLLDNYGGSAVAILRTYNDQLLRNRLGN